MEDRSKITLEFGPVSKARVESLRSLRRNYAPEDAPSKLEAAILESGVIEDVAERDLAGTISIGLADVVVGSDNDSIQEVARRLREDGIAFTIRDYGCEGYGSDITYWRPGMPKAIRHLTGGGEGNILLDAKEVLAALQDNPAAIAAIEDSFNLGGIDLTI